LDPSANARNQHVKNEWGDIMHQSKSSLLLKVKSKSRATKIYSQKEDGARSEEVKIFQSFQRKNTDTC